MSEGFKRHGWRTGLWLCAALVAFAFTCAGSDALAAREKTSAQDTHWTSEAEDTFCLSPGMADKLMTREEWRMHSQRIQNLKPQEKTAYQTQWHGKFIEEARQRGMNVPDVSAGHGKQSRVERPTMFLAQVFADSDKKEQKRGTASEGAKETKPGGDLGTGGEDTESDAVKTDIDQDRERLDLDKGVDDFDINRDDLDTDRGFKTDKNFITNHELGFNKEADMDRPDMDRNMESESEGMPADQDVTKSEDYSWDMAGEAAGA